MYQAELQLNGTTRSYQSTQGKHKANDYIEVASEMFYVASKVKQTCL